MDVMHLPTKFGEKIYIQTGVIDIFPKSILDFQDK